MEYNKVQTIAVIGAGMVAETHLLSLADLKHKIHLSGILGKSPERATALAKQASDLCGYPVKTYADIDVLCQDNTIDWVIVLTPPNARLKIIEKLAKAGKPVLTEKPIERDLATAQKIVEICEYHKVSLGVVFQHRMREASQTLHKLIEEDVLGELAIVEAYVPWWREQSYYDEPGRGTYERDGGGVLISQAIHTLDLMLSLTGAVSEIQAMASTTKLHELEAEDYVTAALRFENGAVGTLIASSASYPGDAESITLHFTKCVVKIQSGELILKWRTGREDRVGASASTGGGADPMAFTHAWHRDIISDFSNAYAQNCAPIVTGREGLKVHALIDALVRSSSQKCAVTVSKVET